MLWYNRQKKEKAGSAMTYIEFFSPVVSENICACLARTPDRVVLIGDNRKLLGRHADRYKELFSEIDRDKPVEFIAKSVNIGWGRCRRWR